MVGGGGAWHDRGCRALGTRGPRRAGGVHPRGTRRARAQTWQKCKPMIRMKIDKNFT